MIFNLEFSDGSEICLTELQFNEITKLAKKRTPQKSRNIKNIDYFCSRIVDSLKVKPLTQSFLVNKFRGHYDEVIESIKKLESDGVVKIDEREHKYSKFKIRLVTLIS